MSASARACSSRSRGGDDYAEEAAAVSVAAFRPDSVIAQCGLQGCEVPNSTGTVRYRVRAVSRPACTDDLATAMQEAQERGWEARAVGRCQSYGALDPDPDPNPNHARLAAPSPPAEDKEGQRERSNNGMGPFTAEDSSSGDGGVCWVRTDLLDRFLDFRAVPPASCGGAAAALLRVQAGMTLSNLASLLGGGRYTLPSWPVLLEQTIGGALGTGSHGSSARHGTVSDCVEAVTLVTDAGELVTVVPERYRDVDAALRGVLGLDARGAAVTTTNRGDGGNACCEGQQWRRRVLASDDVLRKQRGAPSAGRARSQTSCSASSRRPRWFGPRWSSTRAPPRRSWQRRSRARPRGGGASTAGSSGEWDTAAAVPERRVERKIFVATPSWLSS